MLGGIAVMPFTWPPHTPCDFGSLVRNHDRRHKLPLGLALDLLETHARSLVRM